MIAVGVDLGGTKIEAQIFAPDWSIADRKRVDTPRRYSDILAKLQTLLDWAHDILHGPVPVGISSAGMINPATGLALTSNLPATGKPLKSDVEARAGHAITFMNDCRALVLSEATFGVAQNTSPVAGLILGTGVGGGLAIDGELVRGHSSVGGEYGHIKAPAHLIVKHELPVIRCGCGRLGCIETLVSGPGLTRIADCVLHQTLSPQTIADSRGSDADVAKVWGIWCELVAELMMTLVLTADPKTIVLGGGLSKISGVAEDLSDALSQVQLQGFRIPEIVTAQGGDASGARGAAYAAWQSAGGQEVG